MKNTLLLLSIGFLSNLSFGQLVYSEILDQNNVSALINDDDLFFNNASQGVAGYEIPKGAGTTSIYAMSPWVGALDGNGQLHISGNSYAFTNFHSGPIADPMYYGTNAYNNQYQNALWSVTDDEIQIHISNYNSIGYTVPSSIMNLPGNGDVSIGVSAQLAPYVDLDNDGIYEPLDGEYPDIRGDKASYIIMNDESYMPSGIELGMEIHFMFYQISSGNYMDNTTFMHVETFNRSTTSYFDYKQTFFVDFDLGNYFDDYIGCDTIADVGYVYNGDNIDETASGNIGYGIDPPCQGLTVLSHDMSSFGYYTSSQAYPYSDPNSPMELWNHMNGLFSNGSQWVYGGAGYVGSYGATAIPTNFMFSGNPSDTTGWAWSEQNTDGANSWNPPADRRVTVTIGENEFLAGTSICSEYAWVYDKSGDRLENVNNVIDISNTLKALYALADGSFLCNGSQYSSLEEESAIVFAIYPNPSTGAITIELPSIEDEINITILDISGRKVFEEKFYNANEIHINMDESEGVYIIKTEINANSSIKRLILE